MMNKVNEIYDEIEWIVAGNGELLKQNYDACDALICVLAFININHNAPRHIYRLLVTSTVF